MGRKKRNNFNESAVSNGQSWRFYYDRLMDLAISTFEWKNLPDTCDERYLERTLFTEGWAVFFKDEDIGYLALKCTNNGQLNEYGIPVNRRAYAVNGYQKAVDESNSVLIWNDKMHNPSFRLVEYYAKRLWDLDRIIDVNARAQKTPVFLQGTETQKLMLQNLYMQYDGNMPVIMGDKTLDIGNVIKAIRTDAPYVGDKIYQLKTQIWNEAMTALGISNVNYQKKERLISDEVMRGMGGTIASRWSRLSERQDAADKINEMFGLDIQVTFREDFRELDDDSMTDYMNKEVRSLTTETEGKDE